MTTSLTEAAYNHCFDRPYSDFICEGPYGDVECCGKKVDRYHCEATHYIMVFDPSADPGCGYMMGGFACDNHTALRAREIRDNRPSRIDVIVYPINPETHMINRAIVSTAWEVLA